MDFIAMKIFQKKQISWTKTIENPHVFQSDKNISSINLHVEQKLGNPNGLHENVSTKRNAFNKNYVDKMYLPMTQQTGEQKYFWCKFSPLAVGQRPQGQMMSFLLQYPAQKIR